MRPRWRRQDHTAERLAPRPPAEVAGDGVVYHNAQAQPLEALGYDTQLQPVRVDGSTSQNVVADKVGGGAGRRRLVLVVAHLDSVNYLEGPDGPAPGADDNGSGSAALASVEIARVLSERAFTHDVRLVLFGDEEQGLHGSRQYVAALSRTDRRRIGAVFNMDMVAGRNTAEPTVLIEGSSLSRSLIKATARAAGPTPDCRSRRRLSRSRATTCPSSTPAFPLCSPSRAPTAPSPGCTPPTMT